MTNTISKLKEGLGSKAVETLNPVRYETDSGYSIVRRCDLDSSISTSGREHCFVVRDPDAYEADITVEITEQVAAEAISRSRGRLSLDGLYWVTCAERHLADYLWKHDDYPPDARLTVDYLTLDNLDLARRWRETESSSSETKATSVGFPSDHRIARDFNVPEPQRTSQPIKVLTENGYFIVRRSDVDASVTDSANQCIFAVEDPHGNKRDISVSFDGQLIADIQARRRNLPLLMESKYWVVCAESRLANYLWEHDQFPDNESMTISELPGDELLMAHHWRDKE